MTEKTDGYAEIIEYLDSKDWNSLEAIESEGRLLFPEKIHLRKGDGSFETIDFLMRPTGPMEEREARKEARSWAAEEGIDPKLDPKLFEDMDGACELWLAIRNPKPMRTKDGKSVHEPLFMDPRELEKKCGSALPPLYSRLQRYKRYVIPEKAIVDPAELAAVVAKIAETRSIAPLVAYDAVSQESCIVYMAQQLMSLTGSESSSASSGSSTPG